MGTLSSKADRGPARQIGRPLYGQMIPLVDRLYNAYLDEIRQEGLIAWPGIDQLPCCGTQCRRSGKIDIARHRACRVHSALTSRDASVRCSQEEPARSLLQQQPAVARLEPSVPMKVRHQTPGNLDLRARKDHLAHAHASDTNRCRGRAGHGWPRCSGLARVRRGAGELAGFGR